MKTYTKLSGSARQVVGDARLLYKIRTEQATSDIAATLKIIGESGDNFRRLTDRTPQRLDVLVVGAGQSQREAIAFGVENRVTAIDLDVLPRGWHPKPYLELLRRNGPVRAAKTVGRKVLGIDRRFQKALCSALGVSKAPAVTFLAMDASAMTFPDASFDLVFSFSVFEHLEQPEATLRECVRVLRPGGVLDVSTHIYSAEGGCHDLRIFAGDRASIPFWAQLRPAQKHLVQEACYMNEWRLDRWRAMFSQQCPGVGFELEPHHDAFDTQLRAELIGLRSAGELTDYSDDELLTVNLKARWRKP